MSFAVRKRRKPKKINRKRVVKESVFLLVCFLGTWWYNGRCKYIYK